ncbi:hypothetical protein JHD48_07405 [Sulfurimonas sp. SAG-AH-194-I05]|nr:hypothetical protein [Sulfurimonas sp. SAG-AH-194-I05]MDF1875557.1 hypothetical protein [Sulfurimonas sp. SAG-AH-194-I05]
MFNNDLLISFAFMAILFLRQISILKQANKINYAPLMLGIGAISSLVHFIIQPNAQDLILLFRESFFPILVALLLYMVMNIMHQTQETENAKTHDHFSRVMAEQVTQLKEFMSDLEGRLTTCQQEDRQAQEEIRLKFIQDINALEAIQENQKKFVEKFEEMDIWHKSVSKSFENFTEVQLPNLDSVIHEHIEIFRVAEQDHYNKLHKSIEKAIENKSDISSDIVGLKEKINSIGKVSEEIATTIVKHTLQQLATVTKPFQNELISLKSHSEGINNSLFESENTLNSIQERSEMLMKQMVLSSNKMNELQEKNTGLNDIYSTIKELMVDMEIIKADYVKSQAQLSLISRELKSSDHGQIENMTEQIQILAKTLSGTIEASLSKLHEHYHIAEEDITQSVQILSQKAKLQKGYTELDSK